MTDVRALLDVPMDDVKKPPVWPAGTYYGFIEKYEPGESREKKTKYVRVFFRITRADESVPAEGLEVDGKPIDLTKRSFGKSFYLMEDKSQHWRLKEFLENVGVEPAGKSMSAALAEIVNKPVKLNIIVKANQDNTELLNDLPDKGGIMSDES